MKGPIGALFYMGLSFGSFCELLLDRITCIVKNNMLMYAIDYVACRLLISMMCKMCTPMRASVSVASSNIVYLSTDIDPQGEVH